MERYPQGDRANSYGEYSSRDKNYITLREGSEESAHGDRDRRLIILGAYLHVGVF